MSITTTVRDEQLAILSSMPFDTVFTIEDGIVSTDNPNSLVVPDLLDGDLSNDNWTPVNGYSGQQGSTGPIMHSSEQFDGGMTAAVLDEGGTYALIVAWYSDEDDLDDDGFPAIDAEGWMLVRHSD